MIEISHLTKKYGDHYAVDDISFTAEPGKVYGFLGPNGAGKSTTMNIITGYIGASSGTVKINEHDILLDAEEAKKQIGYLPELPPVYSDMTVYEYLKFCAELKKISKLSRAAAIDEVMEMTKVTSMKNRLIKNLSKGYKQRVGLAQALLSNPEVIILDEPSVGLDPEQIIEMRELIRSLKYNHTVILSSHILSEVQEVCDYVFIINNGKLVASDSIENLESRFNSNQVIELTTLGEKELILSTLDNIENVKSVKVENTDNENNISLSIEIEGNNDIRADISLALSSVGIPVMGMALKSSSLEDIFLELTKKTKEEVVEDVSDL